jgi:hypothetical protein
VGAGFLNLKRDPLSGSYLGARDAVFLIKKGTSGDNRFGSDPVGYSGQGMAAASY